MLSVVNITINCFLFSPDVMPSNVYVKSDWWGNNSDLHV